MRESLQAPLVQKKSYGGFVQPLSFGQETARQCVAEAIGTFFLALIGFGQNCQSRFSAEFLLPMNELIQGPIGFGVGAYIGVLAVVGVSGAHLNPAVSLALAVQGKFSFAKLPYYCLAQILGAFFGGTLVFFNYYNYFEYWSGRFDPHMRMTQLGSIFTSFPDPVVSNLESFFDNFIAAFLLLFCIAIFTDKKNMHSDKMFIPVHLAMAITMIGGTLSLNCGSAANPAIDFGAGTQMMTGHNYYFYIPIMGACTGGVLGLQFYRLIKGPVMAELICTFLLVFVIINCTASFTLSHLVQKPLIIIANGGLTAPLIVGIALYFSIIGSMEHSGAHLNPAVTITLAIYRKIKPLEAVKFIGAQMAGAFIAAGIATINNIDYINFLKSLDSLTQQEKNERIARIYTTFPNPAQDKIGETYPHILQSFFDQVFSTAVLGFVVFAIVDKNNPAGGKERVPLALLLIIIGLSSAFSYICGGALNPARDLPPRIVACMVIGSDYPFTAYDYFFWVPIIGPIAGAIWGSALYYLLIGRQLELGAVAKQQSSLNRHSQNVSMAQIIEEEEDEDGNPSGRKGSSVSDV